MEKTVQFELNGRPVSPDADPEKMLLWVLRTELGLTGTKFGCGAGFCGACTVLIDGEAFRSCQFPLKNARGRRVMTIEGLTVDGRLHPLQEAFVRHNVMQCGYCTPGMILTAYSYLRKNPWPNRDQILRAMEDNLCRCGGYTRILQAVESAVQAMRRGAGR